MKKINHYCIICGKGYYSCDSCNRMKKIKPWQTIACTSNCYNIYLVVNDYCNNVINKDMARNMLNRCDIRNYKKYEKNVKEVLEKILEDCPSN